LNTPHPSFSTTKPETKPPKNHDSDHSGRKSSAVVLSDHAGGTRWVRFAHSVRGVTFHDIRPALASFRLNEYPKLFRRSSFSFRHSRHSRASIYTERLRKIAPPRWSFRCGDPKTNHFLGFCVLKAMRAAAQSGAINDLCAFWSPLPPDVGEFSRAGACFRTQYALIWKWAMVR